MTDTCTSDSGRWVSVPEDNLLFVVNYCSNDLFSGDLSDEEAREMARNLRRPYKALGFDTEPLDRYLNTDSHRSEGRS